MRGDDHVYAIDRVVIHEDTRRERERERLSRAAGISHANVVSNVEVMAQGDELHVVTAHVAGVSLDMIEARDPDPRHRLVLPVLIDLLYGLHAIHARGLVHGRVCPANVIVGTDGIGRIAGLHRASPDPQIVYAAPEQLAGDADIDCRADVFSLGVMLWSSLTGRVLYKGMDERSLIYERDVPRPSAIGRHPPAILDSIVLKALELDPSQRFATAEEMAHALRDVAIKTSCLGTSEEVGDWVARLFGAELDAQAAVVGRARSAAIPVHAMPESVATSMPITRAPRGSGWKLLLVSIVSALAVAGVLGWLSRGRTASGADVPVMRSPIEITVLELRRVAPPAATTTPATTTVEPPPTTTEPVATEPPVTAPPITTVRQQTPTAKRVPARPAGVQLRAKPDEPHEPAAKPPAKPAATTPLEDNPYVYK